MQLAQANRLATDVPLRTARAGLAVLEQAERLVAVGNPNAISDIGVAAHLALACVEGGALNVGINLPSLPADDPGRGGAAAEIDALQNRARAAARPHRRRRREPDGRTARSEADTDMTARLLDGRAVASRLWRELGDRVAALTDAAGTAPRLAIVHFAAGGPAAVYADSIARAARGIGIEPIVVTPPDGVTLIDLAARIGALNRDPSVAGIVVAQPVPPHLVAHEVVALIEPTKDVDGATP